VQCEHVAKASHFSCTSHWTFAVQLDVVGQCGRKVFGPLCHITA
jgi:hypothetical protein